MRATRQKHLSCFRSDEAPDFPSCLGWLVGSARLAWLSGVHLDEDGLTFIDGDDDPVPAHCKSPMLTCWRKLWVEFDKMPSADADEPFGSKGDDTSHGLTANVLSDEVLAPWDPNGFRGAVLDPDENVARTQLGRDANGNLEQWEVRSAATYGQIGWVQVTTDYRTDKIDNDGDGTIDEADEQWTMAGYEAGEPFAVNTDDAEWLVELEPPTAAAIVASMCAYFEPAYIDVQEESEHNEHDTVQVFMRNLNNAYGNTACLDIPGGPEFWCVRVLWAYACRKDSQDGNPPGAEVGSYCGAWDRDRAGVPSSAPPGTVGSVSGQVTAIGGESCDIYLEIAREWQDDVAEIGRTVTHEVGHLLGLEHADPHYDEESDDISPNPNHKGLMGFSWPWEDGVSTQRWYQLKEQHQILSGDAGMDQFSQKNVAQLRKDATD